VPEQAAQALFLKSQSEHWLRRWIESRPVTGRQTPTEVDFGVAEVSHEPEGSQRWVIQPDSHRRSVVPIGQAW